MLPGIRVKDLKTHVDDRGFLVEVMRQDWNDLVEEDDLLQSNLSMSYPGTIRAWHRHERAQTEYYIALKGAIRICAYDDEEGSATRGQLTEIVTSEKKLQMVRIPGHYWHGNMTVSPTASLTLFFKNTLYDYDDPDEQRRPWNDPTIVDPRTDRPYDWLRPVHK